MNNDKTCPKNHIYVCKYNGLHFSDITSGVQRNYLLIGGGKNLHFAIWIYELKMNFNRIIMKYMKICTT